MADLFDDDPVVGQVTDNKGFQYFVTTNTLGFVVRWYTDSKRAEQFSAEVKASNQVVTSGRFSGSKLGGMFYSPQKKDQPELFGVACQR